VVARPGTRVDSAALIAFCRDGLAAFKRPRAVVEVAALPKTATGKVRRNVLRVLVADVLRDGGAAPDPASAVAPAPTGLPD
jgi:benzoate-CoA ligase